MKTEVLTTAAGHTITAKIFPAIGSSEQKASKGVCIIATATGVAQRLYADFANWLTEHIVGYDMNLGFYLMGVMK